MQAENVHRRYRHTTIKLYSHEISRLHHILEWNMLVTLVYSTPECGVTYTNPVNIEKYQTYRAYVKVSYYTQLALSTLSHCAVLMGTALISVSWSSLLSQCQ